MVDNKQEQIQIAEKLQLKWLKRMETMLDEGTITSTDLATLSRFLMQNGWSLDPSRLPEKLRDKLTDHMGDDFDDLPVRLVK